MKCPNCQLEFISNDHLTYHFKSYSHKEVISGQYLPKNYNCFVCLKGFDNPNEWFEHCQDKSHFQMLSWCGIKSDDQSADNSTSDGDIFETVNSPEKLEEALEAVDSPEEEQISDSESEHIDNVKVKSENYFDVKVKVEEFYENDTFENVDSSPEDNKPTKFDESLEYVDPDSPEIIEEEEINQIKKEEKEVERNANFREIDTLENVDSSEEEVIDNEETRKMCLICKAHKEGNHAGKALPGTSSFKSICFISLCKKCGKRGHVDAHCPTVTEGGSTSALQLPEKRKRKKRNKGIKARLRKLEYQERLNNSLTLGMTLVQKSSEKISEDNFEPVDSPEQMEENCDDDHDEHQQPTENLYEIVRNEAEIDTFEPLETEKVPKPMKQTEGLNNVCIFCLKNQHKYQLFCPKLKQLQPNEIYSTMYNAGIECQMCLGLGHETINCPAVKEGILKKCKIMDNNTVCGKFHCRYLHKSENCAESLPLKPEQNIQELEEIDKEKRPDEIPWSRIISAPSEILPQDDDSYMDQLLDNKIIVKSEFFPENNTNKSFSENVEESGDENNQMNLEEIDSSEVSLSDVDNDDQISLSSLEDHNIEISDSNVVVDKSNGDELLESVDSPDEFNDQQSDSDIDEFVVLDQA